MAVWSIVKKSQLFGAMRIDAEFYRQKYEKVQKAILSSPKTVKLGDIITKFSKGIFDIKAGDYVPYGVPFVRISNLKDCIIDEEGLVFIKPERHKIEAKSALEKYDIILSKTAYPAASLVQIETCNCSQDTIAVSTNYSEDFNVYLTVYLNTSFGISQMQRLFQGNIQKHLSLVDARTITVPIPDESFQTEIRQIFELSLQKRQESKRLYAEAEDHLMHELDIHTMDRSKQTTYTANLSETMNTHRFDAEYFQPRFQQAFNVLGCQEKTIEDVSKIAKRPFRARKGKSFQYIEIADVHADGYVSSKEVLGDEAPSRAKWVVHPGDVITSSVRPIRRLSALIEKNQLGFVCSSGFVVLESKGIPPELLLVYLRLPIVAEILDLYTTASMYPAISTADFLSVPFYIPSDKAIDIIRTKVQKSRTLREESNCLLEEAKQKVEQMILSAEA